MRLKDKIEVTIGFIILGSIIVFPILGLVALIKYIFFG